ncbi:MAG: peptidyl-tRNA hydrolase, partial [Treponema sp.]|nr:peptidyl-tRNA hydrolase [Treponema sp.]
MLRLAVFLGNPGPEYKFNRHNSGWMLAEALPFFPALNWGKIFKGLHASLDSARSHAFDRLPSFKPAAMPEKLHFIKPQTFMNLSGESVREI